MGIITKKRIIWLVILIGLALRVISLDQSLWLDEAINVIATQNYNFWGMVTEYAKADFHPPGYFIIIWIWTKFFGISEIAVRVPSVIFGLVTVYVVYLTGQKLYSRGLGLVSALLLAINPLHIYYSQEARMYALAVLAVSLNFFLIVRLIKGEKVSLLLLLFSNLFVLTSDYVAYLIFPAQFIFLLMIKRKLLKTWTIVLFSAILIGFWWIPTFLNQLDIGAVASSNLPAWKFIVGGFDPKAVPLTFVKFIIGRISYPDKLIYALIVLPVSSLFLFLLWRGTKLIKRLERSLILSWILVPIILATLISFVIPIYSYFRLQFILPAFTLLVALGIFSFKLKLRYFLFAAVLVIQVFSLSVYLFNPVFQRDDWKGVVSFLKTLGNTPVLFESSGTLPPFDYYSGGTINAKGALKDFPAKDMNDVTDMENILQGAKELYLVEYLVDISDPNRLVAKRLIELGYNLSQTYNFNGVGFIYHFRK